jgi:hypothetical protein
MNKIYFEFSQSSNNITITEQGEKPINCRHALSSFAQFFSAITNAFKAQLYQTKITYKKLDGSIFNYSSRVEEGQRLLQTITDQLSDGYLRAYNTRRSTLLKIYDMVKSFFGWQTDKEKIESYRNQICQTVNAPQKGIEPNNPAFSELCTIFKDTDTIEHRSYFFNTLLELPEHKISFLINNRYKHIVKDGDSVESRLAILQALVKIESTKQFLPDLLARPYWNVFKEKEKESDIERAEFCKLYASLPENFQSIKSLMDEAFYSGQFESYKGAEILSCIIQICPILTHKLAINNTYDLPLLKACLQISADQRSEIIALAADIFREVDDATNRGAILKALAQISPPLRTGILKTYKKLLLPRLDHFETANSLLETAKKNGNEKEIAQCELFRTYDILELPQFSIKCKPHSDGTDRANSLIVLASIPEEERESVIHLVQKMFESELLDRQALPSTYAERLNLAFHASLILPEFLKQDGLSLDDTRFLKVISKLSSENINHLIDLVHTGFNYQDKTNIHSKEIKLADHTNSSSSYKRLTFVELVADALPIFKLERKFSKKEKITVLAAINPIAKNGRENFIKAIAPLLKNVPIEIYGPLILQVYYHIYDPIEVEDIVTKASPLIANKQQTDSIIDILKKVKKIQKDDREDVITKTHDLIREKDIWCIDPILYAIATVPAEYRDRILSDNQERLLASKDGYDISRIIKEAWTNIKPIQ